MRKTALITGASYGIGKELAELFAKDQINLVLVARSKDVLEKLAVDLKQTYSIDAEVIASDLSKPTAAYELYEQCQQKQISIDYLVNNAGFGLYGEFLNTDLQKEIDMIEVNIKSLMVLTKLFLPHMVERGEGKILNVASMASFQPGPLMAVYYATKSFVLHFSEALANELKGTGVTVTALCPGPTETMFGKRAGLDQSKLFQRGVMDAKTVAKLGYRGFMAGKTIVIPGVMNRLSAFCIRFLPRSLVTRIVRQIQERRIV